MFSIMNGFTFLATASTAASSTDATMAMITQVGMIALVIVGLYFIMIRPQRKRDKETTAMRKNLQVGDQVTTSGGIVGRVVSIKDDSVTLETGSDRVKIRVMRWAISVNNTKHDE